MKNGLMPKYCIYTLPIAALTSVEKDFKSYSIPTNVLDMRKNSNRTCIIPYSINFVDHDHMILGGLDSQMKDISSNLFFIVDEFHKTLNPTKRTSITLEITSLCHDFVGMSGTIIKDNNPSDLILWLSSISEFEVTEKNYYVAIGALISNKIQTKVIVDRIDIDVLMSESYLDSYRKLVPMLLGGSSSNLRFREAIDLCYKVINDEIIRYVLTLREKVFVVAKDVASQNTISKSLTQKGLICHCITKDTPLNYLHDDPRNIDVVITTPSHNAGYNLTKIGIMVTSVYFSNQATRDQLVGRINRIGQPRDRVEVITFHTGLLSYILEKYEMARSMSELLREFAKTVEVVNDLGD